MSKGEFEQQQKEGKYKKKKEDVKDIEGQKRNSERPRERRSRNTKIEGPSPKMQNIAKGKREGDKMIKKTEEMRKENTKGKKNTEIRGKEGRNKEKNKEIDRKGSQTNQATEKERRMLNAVLSSKNIVKNRER